jgi:hypothetical protein
MNTVVEFPQDVGAGFLQEFSNIATWVNVPVDEVTKRSKDNILRWGVYLPISCIATMIKMGWDKTT